MSCGAVPRRGAIAKGLKILTNLVCIDGTPLSSLTLPRSRPLWGGRGGLFPHDAVPTNSALMEKV